MALPHRLLAVLVGSIERWDPMRASRMTVRGRSRPKCSIRVTLVRRKLLRLLYPARQNLMLDAKNFTFCCRVSS